MACFGRPDRRGGGAFRVSGTKQPNQLVITYVLGRFTTHGSTKRAHRRRVLRRLTRMGARSHAPDRDLPQRFDDDPATDLRTTVLALAERDRCLDHRESVSPRAVGELDLEPVPVGADGYLQKGAERAGAEDA